MARQVVQGTCYNCLGAKVIYTSALGSHKRSDFRLGELLQVLSANLVTQVQCPVCLGRGTIDILVRGRRAVMGKRVFSRIPLNMQAARAAERKAYAGTLTVAEILRTLKEPPRGWVHHCDGSLEPRTLGRRAARSEAHRTH